jgi:hypothetical protein
MKALKDQIGLRVRVKKPKDITYQQNGLLNLYL